MLIQVIVLVAAPRLNCKDSMFPQPDIICHQECCDLSNYMFVCFLHNLVEKMIGKDTGYKIIFLLTFYIYSIIL